MASSSATESVRRQFGSVAANYATSAVHVSGPDLAALVEAAALTGSEHVLDLGSGAGHTALALAPAARAVVGIDVTPEMVAVATDLARDRGLDNVTFRLGDVTGLPFEPEAFDLVTSRYSAHHFANPQAALAEAARVLRPGARLLLADTVAPEEPALDTYLNAVEMLRDASHVRDWRASEWVRLCEGAGLGARVIARTVVALDGAAWVQRMNTPPAKVAMLQQLLGEATPAQRAAFDIQQQPWGLSMPVALVEATKHA